MSPYEQFEQAGYASTHSIYNIHCIFLFAIALFIWWGVIAIFIKCGNKALKTIGKKMGDVCFWRVSIRFLLLIYLPLTISSLHNFMSPKWDFPTIFAGCSLLLVAAFAILCTYYQIYSLKASPRDIRKKFAYLSNILHIRPADKRATMFITTYIWRRLIFAGFVCFAPTFYAG